MMLRHCLLTQYYGWLSTCPNPVYVVTGLYNLNINHLRIKKSIHKGEDMSKGMGRGGKGGGEQQVTWEEGTGRSEDSLGFIEPV